MRLEITVEERPELLELPLAGQEQLEILDLLKADNSSDASPDAELDAEPDVGPEEDQPFLPTENELIHLAQCLQSEHNAHMQEILNALGDWEELEDQGYDDDDAEALTKAWSDEAREAARAARAKRFASEPSPFADVHVHSDSKTHTGIDQPTEAKGIIRGPRTDGIKLTKDTRPSSFVQAHSLITEKYGPHRGDGIYNSIIDRAENVKGLHYIVSSKIQKEKLAMMGALGKEGHPNQHHYQGLHKLYKDKMSSDQPSLLSSSTPALAARASA